MSLYKYGSSSRSVVTHPVTEFDILKASHKFLRTDDGNSQNLSWNDQLAKKYYDSLYREFAICDLKHYKSGNFALRWRTESEVLSGAGESTCGNTRCPHYVSNEHLPPLTTLELPFAYEEHAERKSALVKVVLCERCVKKMMWRRRREKVENGGENEGQGMEGREEMEMNRGGKEEGRKEKGHEEREYGLDDKDCGVDAADKREEINSSRRERRRSENGRDGTARRRRSSRSLSPRHRFDTDQSRHSINRGRSP